MAQTEYIIAEQLKHWMKLRKATKRDLYKFFGKLGRIRYERWLAGCRVHVQTIVKLAEFFHTTPQKFYGNTIGYEDNRPCGVKRVLRILNEEGGDYLNDSPLVRLNQREWKLEVDEMMANLKRTKINENECG